MKNFMGTLFRWFYGLRIWQSVVLLVLATVFIVFLKKISPKVSKILFSVSLVLWFAVMLYHTLLGRTGGGSYYVKLLPFQSYIDLYNGATKELFRANYMNVVLYYPGGLLFGLLAKDKKTCIAGIICFCLMSVLIEFFQYYFAVGYAETDDVIHNTLGAVIGILVSRAACIKNKNE